MSVTMGVPKIKFTYRAAAQSVAMRMKQGVVALIVQDPGTAAGVYSIGDVDDIPKGLSESSVAYIKMALIGSRWNTPSNVLVSVIDTDADIVTAGAAALAAKDFDYLCGPPDMTAEEAASVKKWLDTARKGYCIGKLVTANYAADDMTVINFASSGIVVGGTTYAGSDFCSRIAGILASTDMSASATFAPLPEVTAVDAIEDQDGAVDAGKLILIHDGRKAKIARAVNSMVTVPDGQSATLKKIKIVEGVDLIRSNAIRMIEENYIGQKPNSYDNKLALVSDLHAFLKELEREGVLASGSGNAEVDFTAQRSWLRAHGTDVAKMTDTEILQANTDSYVFIQLSGTLQDAMEDFQTTLIMGGNA